MSGKGAEGGKGTGRSVKSESTNSQGNSCKQYNDGAYAYNNTDGSKYYNSGDNHGFYKSPPEGNQSSNGQPYKAHFNYNQGTSTRKPK